MNTITRPRYRERQQLRTADLRDEQHYRIDARWRHNAAAHTWGIAHGLMLQLVPGIDGLVLSPGLAIDGYGRELILPHAVQMTSAELNKQFECLALTPDEDLAVWLVYIRALATDGLPGSPGHNRWREGATFVFTPQRQGEPIDVWHPQQVSPVELEYNFYKPVDEDALGPWPVFVGCVKFDGTAGQPTVVGISSLASRPYVRLAGASLHTPDGRAVVCLEPEDETQAAGLAIRLRDTTKNTLTDRLVMRRSGRAELNGHTHVHRSESAVATQIKTAALQLQPLPAVPTLPMPWRIYRVDVPREGKPPLRQLRIELFHPGKDGDASRYGVQLGPMLVTANGDVICADGALSTNAEALRLGELTTGGDIIQGTYTTDPRDSRFVKQALVEWFNSVVLTMRGLEVVKKGSSGSSDLLIKIIDPPIGPDINAGSLVFKPGELKEFKFTLTNNGSAYLNNIQVNDFQLLFKDLGTGPSRTTGQPIKLQALFPGETKTFTRPVVDTQSLKLAALTVVISASASAPGNQALAATSYFPALIKS